MDQEVTQITTEDDLDEAGIIAGLLGDEPRAAAEFVGRYGPRMLAVIRRIVSEEAAAQDCLQDAFLGAFKALSKFEGRAQLSTWLHRIAVNAALKRRQADQRRGEESIDELLPEFDGDGCRIQPQLYFPESSEDFLSRREVRDQVLAKVEELPETYRIVFVLRDIEELSTKEVAEALDLSEGAVKVRLHRARSALKQLLEPLWHERKE